MYKRDYRKYNPRLRARKTSRLLKRKMEFTPPRILIPRELFFELEFSDISESGPPLNNGSK